MAIILLAAMEWAGESVINVIRDWKPSHILAGI